MSNIVNGLIGDHIATGIPVEIPLNSKEMQLAMDKTRPNESWDLMCESLISRGCIDPRGNMHIDFIRINRLDKPFH
jgi:hypothetical protein